MPNRRPNKRRAFPASKENTTMSKVRRLASFAKQTPFPRTKTEPPNAHHVRKAVPPKRAAPNVPIAHRANLNTLSTTKKFAPTAPLALHKVTRTKQVVRNVFKEKKHQRAELVFVRRAISVNSI